MTRKAAAAPVVVWFRQDLRLADNPALAAAARGGRPVVPLYIFDEITPGRWAPGGAARWWLHHSLAALGARLESLGAPLVLRRGAAAEILPALVREIGAGALYWNRGYEPFAIESENAIEAALAESVTTARFDTALLHEPGTVTTGAGRPYRVFTAFWRACLARDPPARPLPAPKALKPFGRRIESARLESWNLRPRKPDWAKGFAKAWRPGEAGAAARLAEFLDGALADYDRDRDRPAPDTTSRLSPHLHWGEIGPRQVWHAVRHAQDAHGGKLARSAQRYLSELGWREFSYHLLHHFPELPQANATRGFDAFPWRRDKRALTAWRRGETGYPIVDAGLRQLWTSGWMHNRVRMIAASFLVKHLLIDWREGAAWFWDTLVDADLANNSASWQWVAGSGFDAAPYFRIFNPVLQGRRFDPEGDYVRAWVPELGALPARHIHAPWAAPAATLRAAGVALGKSYPKPIVDHAAARARALAAFKALAKS